MKGQEFDEIDWPNPEPDIVSECPNCGGTVGVFLEQVGEYDTCTIGGVVHLQPDREE